MTIEKTLVPADIHNILLSTDFSCYSEAALAQAVVIARQYSARIYITHIITPEICQFQGPDTVANTIAVVHQCCERDLSEVTRSVAQEGVHAEYLLRQGNIEDVLLDQIEKYDIDLVVVGTHGRTGFKRFILGSVAEQVLRFSPCPVLTVGPNVPGDVGTPTGPRTILFPTDFTSDSLSAAPLAFSLACRYQALLILLHVAKGKRTPLETEHSAHAFDRDLREAVSTGADMQREPERVVMFGSVVEDILDVTAKRGVDLIVLGVRRPGDLSWAVTHLPGSVTYRIVAEAGCPVLTVRNVADRRRPSAP